MRLFPEMVGLLLAAVGVSGAADPDPAPRGETRRLLYMSTPDGAQQEGRSGNGILVFDIDDGHRFVKRIDLPIFAEGIRGLTGSAVTGCVYYSTSNRRLGCFDVAKEEVVWESQFDRGCDRSCITPDGKRIYVPTGWWFQGADSGFLVVDAATGKEIDRIAVGTAAHNSIASLDGRFVYLGTTTKLTQFRASDGKVLQSIEPVGESGVFPYTVDQANRRAFVCLGKHVGFDVVDLGKGEVLHRVFAGEEPIPNRTHGAGMTPDGRELWISDQVGRKLFIFDITRTPPVAAGDVDLSMGGHGWITFSLDGRFAWCHTPDVFDVKSRARVATLRDERGEPFASSKFIEVHVRDGEVVAMGNEFGLGRASGEE